MARRTFFSFHYLPDVWRAWNVRNCWVIKDEKVDSGFFDSSVFEASKRQGEENLKNFLRDGMANTSVTCVLTGTDTWSRRWVRYEIARSVIKGNGLLSIYIHGVKDKDQKLAVKGADPLAQMGVYKSGDQIYLAEWSGGKWIKYEDYSLPISAGTLWFAAPTSSDVVQLCAYCKSYDFSSGDGRTNIGRWIETAAISTGR